MVTYAEPGPKPQWFGTVTTYPRQRIYEFDNDRAICKSAKDNKGNPPIRVRFAEGGSGHICGTVRWEMPSDPKKLIEIQKDFSSAQAVEDNLVARALVNAVFLSGQTMTSSQSAAERRADLLHYVEDQMRLGVYKTTTKQTRVVDAVTKQERTITVVEIMKDAAGSPLRNNVSAIAEYGVKLVQTSFSEIPYDKAVEDQISSQQQAAAAVSVEIANAIAAEQKTRTTIEKGKQLAAEAQWQQETVKAKAVTLAKQEKEVEETAAEKRKNVAKLDKDAAEYTKQKEILLGQGESERRKLVLAADGALEKKLEAYVTVQSAYAQAMGEYKGAWVPATVMGGGASGSLNGASALVELLTAKTARDLQLDMSVKK
jgi:hypothetical protein